MLGTTEPSPRFAAQTAAASRIAPQPTLYLHGDRDGSTTDPIYADAAAFLSTGSRIEVVDGTGHFPHVEEPDIVNALIVDWITRRSDDQ
jgi:pimeloyl-ACP methyl ester carboxylesterase